MPPEPKPTQRKAPYVVDLRKITPVPGVPEHDENFFYHSGGVRRSADWVRLDVMRPNQITELPPWAKMEVTKHGELIARKAALEKRVLSGISGAELEAANQNLAEARALLKKAGDDLLGKLERGEFQSPYGKLSNADIFNASIHSFAQGPLSNSMMAEKNQANRGPKEREEYDFLRMAAGRKGTLSRIFNKPLTEVTDEEVRREIGKGRVFENDLLLIKAIGGRLKPEEIEDGRKKGVIGDVEAKFYGLVGFGTKEDSEGELVYSTKGIGSFSRFGIIVEAEHADVTKNEFPFFMGMVPQQSIRAVYTHSPELRQKGMSDAEMQNEVNARVNTFLEARKIAERHGDRLRAGGKDALVKELGVHPDLIDIAHKIAADHPDFSLGTRKTKIPEIEI